MIKVFVDLGISLDGFIAGPNGGPDNPLGDGGTRVHQWVYTQSSWRHALGFSGGETGSDDALIRETIERAGAHVMGRRMFDEGEANWPEEAPFHAPMFVVTGQEREPWPRPGGTTFYFVTDGIESAIARAKSVANRKDVRIAGGASVVRQALDLRLVDQLVLHVAPIGLGNGVRLFDGSSAPSLKLESKRVLAAPLVTHLYYDVVR